MNGVKSNEEAAFFQNAEEYLARASSSARNILPHLFELVRPRTVVDFGCGGGAWLSVCRELGATEILGVDGSYADTSKLLFPAEHFLAHNLQEPLQLSRSFDLAISLEVAEHIPTEHSATFVASLTRLAPVILFSAAIPFQGGIGHVNEQWPSYWADHFSRKGYCPIDMIRRLVWENNSVDTWYKQNSILFVQDDFLARHPVLKAVHEETKSFPLNIVHPNRYLVEADPQHLNPQKVPLAIAYTALKLQLRRKLRSNLHWRLQRLL